MISFGSRFTLRPHTWTSWKAALAAKGSPHQYNNDGTLLTIWFYDADDVHFCTIWLGEVPHGVIAGGYSQAQNDADKAEFVTGYWPSVDKRVAPPRNQYGNTKVEAVARSGNKAQVISQNFCDKHTWYTTSVRHNGVSMVDSGNGLTWGLASPKVGVDVCHARILHERRLWPTYLVVVTVDGVAKVEKNIHTGVGDFVVDYETMSVTFDASQAGKTVTIGYHEVVNSKWFIAPTTGKILRLLSAELNFSSDVRMRDTFMFSFQADVAKCPYFAAYWDANGGPYPAGTMIPLADPVFYQTQRDLVVESNLAYPIIRKTQASLAEPLTWRDLKQDMDTYSWDYAEQATLDMLASWGMQIEISLEHDIACGGDSAIITFYCLSEDEKV